MMGSSYRNQDTPPSRDGYAPDEIRRRNRKRRQERQRRRRRRQLLHLGLTLAVCFAFVIAGAAILRSFTSPGGSGAASQGLGSGIVTVVNENQGQEASGDAAPVVPDQEEISATPVDPNSVVYLTFDDGPSAVSTEAILDVLKANDIHATFFIVNYDADKIPLLQRMVNEGHTIGIHAYTHDYQTCYADDTSYIDGIVRMQEKLKQDVNYDVFCIRFPGGSSNSISSRWNTGVMTRLAEKVQGMGMEYYDWNVDSTDASGNNIPPATLVSSVTGGLKAGRDNMVLMHDTDAKKTTVESLQEIIDYGKEHGFHFEAISRNTPAVHHKIIN